MFLFHNQATWQIPTTLLEGFMMGFLCHEASTWPDWLASLPGFVERDGPMNSFGASVNAPTIPSMGHT